MLGWEFNFDKDFGYWSKDKTIRFYKPEWKNYRLAVVFDKTFCIGFAWGIRKMDSKIKDLPGKTLNDLNSFLKKPGKKSDWWSWSCDFPEPYFDWRKNIEPWIDIQSGEMAKMIVKEIAELAHAAEKIIDEAERRIECEE